MSARRISIGSSLVIGLLLAGGVGIGLELAEVPFGSGIGAFVGGLVAAWVLCTRRGRASVVGFLVGVFSLPIQLLILVGLVSSALYTPPPAPNVPQDVLLAALAATLAIQVIGGTVGGLLGSLLHHPPPELVEPPHPYLPPAPLSLDKYCIQCGAALPKGMIVCPACGVKQPP